MVKQGSKLAASITKLAARSAASAGVVDSDTADIVEGVADAAQNQAEAGRDATVADRVKMAAGDSAGVVADNVDNTYVSVSGVCACVCVCVRTTLSACCLPWTTLGRTGICI